MNDNTTPIKAALYDQSIEQTIPYYSAFGEQAIDVVRTWLGERKEKAFSWLDTGCGTGALAVLADNSFKNISWTLLDPSHKMLEVCRRQGIFRQNMERDPHNK